MDIKDIKKIIELMKENELTEFALEEEGFKINLKRKNGDAQMVVSSPAVAPVMVASPVMAGAPVAAPAPLGAGSTHAGVAPAPEAAPSNYKDIKSPMVGTFYRAASPEAEAFVSVGSTVDEDTVVCIIEAMKVMNEIKAEVKGVIRKIMIENATSVEFGQVLFQVEPQ